MHILQAHDSMYTQSKTIEVYGSYFKLSVLQRYR